VRVGLFITCLTDTFFPRVGVAVVKTLRHFGCDVEFPAEQTCCGQPGYTSGLLAESAALLERMVDVFEPYDHVVSPSGSCVSWVKLHGPQLFADAAKRARVEALGAKMHEFCMFLDQVLEVDWSTLGIELPGGFTYHYPCHLRGLVDASEAEAMVSKLDSGYTRCTGLEECCGFGGTFATSYPAISGAMLREKVRAIEKTGATTLICSEGGCGLNIAGSLRRRASAVRVRHVAELIAAAQGLKLPDEDGR
jgi:L-lactate dehydrogenase complex protein LldE